MNRILSHAERTYRRIATGFLFFAFSLGGLCLTVLVLPALGLFSSGDTRAMQLRARRAVARAFRLFVWAGTALRVFRFSTDGVERLTTFRGLVVGNHPTLIDVVMLVSECPEVACLAKGELLDHRWYGRVARAAGFVRNDRDPRIFLDRCVAELQAGGSLLIFPEGTRSPVGGLGPFQRGAAHVALQAGCQVLPVTLICEPPTLMKGIKWYEVPERPFHLHLQVGQPLSPLDIIAPGTPRARAVRTLNLILVEHFEEQLAHAHS